MVFIELDYVTYYQTNGGHFVNSFCKESFKTLAQFQADIADGSTQWLERLFYYSQRVAGSPGYWRAKRAEVYT